MTSTIITKNSSTASSVPSSGSLTQGELAVNVTDKKLYTKDSGGTVVKLVGSLGNQEASAAAITGGSINGTTVGASTASTGAFTTLSASSTVSGTGFSTYLASPPAIGGTAAAAGSFTTLSASGAVTLSGGTANGVAYLNGSKVVTSGSALTFDGSKLSVARASNGDVAAFSNSSDADLLIKLNSGVSLLSPTTSILSFGVSNSEQMRLTSTGLGIGTSSPTEKLTVAGAISATSNAANFDQNKATFDYASGAGRMASYVSTGSNLQFFTNASGGTVNERMRIDSSGNLGLGVTPSAWGIGKTLQVNSASLMGYLNRLYASANTYFDGTGTAKYIASDSATSYQQLNGQHQWFTAASGTAGNAITFTQAMSLLASGELLVGTTSAGDSKVVFSFPGTVVGLTLQDSVDNSNAYFQAFRNSGGTIIGSVTRVTTTNAVIYNTTSDYRLKNVTGAVTGQGARIDALKPIDYLWKEGNTQARGFLAHEFQTVYPNSVSGDKDSVDTEGNPKYQAMQAGSAEVIADLVAEIQSLRKRLADAGI